MTCAGRRLAKKRCIPTRVMRGRTCRCRIWGTVVFWEFALVLALPIALLVVLAIVQAFFSFEVASFLDQLVIAGILAFGIVRAFFA